MSGVVLATPPSAAALPLVVGGKMADEEQQKSEANNVVVSDNDQSPSPSEPDMDAIKMFVGQIPRNWNEVDCRRLFETYGPVFACNILRDKSTQASKGCCFVTFYHRKDAIEAQGALHNIKVIEGMHHPVQMKPADTENRNERKLFIGQLSKKHNEENLREIFAKFGQIEDCSVLRDQDGKSRGCAFVTFTNRSCAVVATKEMHHSQTMEGCSAPLVVKFADTQKDKDGKTKSIGSASGVSAGSPKGGLLNGINPALLQQFGGGAQNYQAVAQILSLINGQQAQPQQQNVLGILGSVLSALGKLTEGDDVACATSSAPVSTTSSSSAEKRLIQPTTSGAAVTTSSAPQIAQQLGAQFIPTGQLDPITMAQLAHQNQLLALQGYAVHQPQQQQVYHHPYHHNQHQQQHQQSAYSTGSPDSSSNTTDSSEEKPPTPHRMYGGYGYVKSIVPVGRRGAANPRYMTPMAPITHFGLAGGLAGAKTTSPVAATLASHQQIALTPFAGGAALDPYSIQQQYALLANLQATQVAAAPGATSMAGNGDVKGPDGANLFIYHLPQDFGDADLINTFAPFGQILSAKVFIDKVTNLSKCFGFVSFDSPQSATNAIAAMNGFQIGSKRLKVQLKVDRGNPYR